MGKDSDAFITVFVTGGTAEGNTGQDQEDPASSPGEDSDQHQVRSEQYLKKRPGA
jgi:hypothetical protein